MGLKDKQISPLHFILDQFLEADAVLSDIHTFQSKTEGEEEIGKTVLLQKNLGMNLFWGGREITEPSYITANTCLELAWSLLRWYLHDTVPDILEAAGFYSYATSLRALPAVRNLEDVQEFFRCLPSVETIEEKLKISLWTQNEKELSPHELLVLTLSDNILEMQSGARAVGNTLLALTESNKPLKKDGSNVSKATELLAAYEIAKCGGFEEFQQAHNLLSDFIHQHPYPFGELQLIAGERVTPATDDNDFENNLKIELGIISKRIRRTLEKVITQNLDTTKQIGLD